MRKFTVLFACLIALGAFAAAQLQPKQFEVPRTELFLGYAYEYANTNGISAVSAGDVDVSSTSMNGVAFGFAHYMTNRLGLALDLSHVANSAVNSTGIKYSRSSYMAGPAYRLNRLGFLTPSVHALVGVENATFTSPQLGGEFNNIYQGYNFSALGGVSLDGNLSRHLGVRLAQVDYLYTTHYNTNQSSFRYSGGVVLRF